MKMVIVFDTDDQQGMTNTLKIVDQLGADYLARTTNLRNKRTFGKIEFIKMLRSFAQQVKFELQDEDVGGLKYSKDIADKIWAAKEGGKRLQ